MKEKLKISYWQERFGLLPFTLLSVAFIALLIWLGYGLGNWRLAYLEQATEQQEQQLDDLYQQVEQLEYQQHIVRVELEIEKAANSSLQQEMAMAQDENFALRRELTFYQKIMAPELEAEGVIIESMELRPNIAENHFHFRLALVQLERQRQLVGGEVRLILRGRLNDEPKQYDLFELANMPSADRKFNMRYFSVLAGDFMVPDGLVPERIDVQVQLTEGGRRMLDRSFYWSRMLEPQIDSQFELIELDGNT